MIKSKTVTLKWNSRNKKHFVEKGYQFTKMRDEFIVNIEDLTPMSKAEIEVVCDYCGEVNTTHFFKRQYRLKNSTVKKDCCTKCSPLKVKESCFALYGVSSTNKLEEKKQKIQQTFMKKYEGHPQRLEWVKMKMKNTSLERYGVDNYTKTTEYRENHSGEKHKRWKGGNYIGRQERSTPEYRLWRLAVFSRDDYTCQCCKSKSKKGVSVTLNAHHILNWKDNESQRYDADNGITLCSNCHRSFHRKYGKENNTLIQLQQFIANYDKDVC